MLPVVGVPLGYLSCRNVSLNKNWYEYWLWVKWIEELLKTGWNWSIQSLICLMLTWNWILNVLIYFLRHLKEIFILAVKCSHSFLEKVSDLKYKLGKAMAIRGDRLLWSWRNISFLHAIKHIPYPYIYIIDVQPVLKPANYCHLLSLLSFASMIDFSCRYYFGYSFNSESLECNPAVNKIK